ncbi:hypothetical protein ACO0QE_002989 [Hanseniaspora vineae]
MSDLEANSSYSSVPSRQLAARNGESRHTGFSDKYGPVKCLWIEPPASAAENKLIVKPFAWNYFYNGILYRTKEERQPTLAELFFDLLYVGITANLANTCIEYSVGSSLAKYILLFLPCWHVWSDMRAFMDYYYNNDATQIAYLLWIMFLLVTYANNAHMVTSNEKPLVGLVVACYMLARFSYATMLLIYNVFFIKEHRKQMMWYCGSLYISVILAGFVILPKHMYQRIIIVCCLYFWDALSYSISFSAWFKKLINTPYHTAMSIEHEIKRHNSFVTIAIGEFLYPTVALTPASGGLNERTARCTCILILAFCLAWFYFSGEGSRKAVHALRRHSLTGLCWIQFHFFLIVSLALAANSGGVLTETKYTTNTDSSGEESPMARSNYLQDVQIYFGSGLAVALVSMTTIALLDKGLDEPIFWKLTPKARIISRFFMAAVAFGLSFAKINITLYLGIVSLLLLLQVIFEKVADVKSYAYKTRMNLVAQASLNSSPSDENSEVVQEQQGSINTDYDPETASEYSVTSEKQRELDCHLPLSLPVSKANTGNDTGTPQKRVEQEQDIEEEQQGSINTDYEPEPQSESPQARSNTKELDCGHAETR